MFRRSGYRFADKIMRHLKFYSYCRCRHQPQPIRLVLSILMAFAILLCVSKTSRAWTMTGHSAVIEIGTRHLSEKAAGQIRNLLDRDPIELADLAMWADDIAEERPETDPWHAVDIPHNGAGYNRERDCKSDDCIVQKIEEFARVLADMHAAKPVRAEALKFLIHFVGDLHVPLHAYAPGPPEDVWDGWGGWEGPWIRIGDKVAQLHTWWDWKFVADLGSSSSEIAARLAAEITAEERMAWERSSSEDWANESFQIAREFVMRHGLIDRDRLEGNSETNPIVLDVAVLEEANRIAARRLKMAGVRLARLLNRAFE
ncbi:MAG: hypothetical protein C3F17_02360 [Bradyrhizobiaceae bacterium]|nr:MAG: hypothetical protein C3F17_02360 [Bradyrhizobiaceae bacterium]